LKAGCLRFDSSLNVKDGWYSISGEPARRFDRVADTDSDAFYIANIDFDTSFKTGLSNSSKVRTSNYLDVDFYNSQERDVKQRVQDSQQVRLAKSPNDMVSHLGIDEENWPLQAELCAEINSRVFLLAKDGFELDSPPFYELKKGVRDSLLPFDPVYEDGQLYDALESSTTHFSLVQREIDSVQWDVDFGLNVALPKVSHALSILSKPLPRFNTKWKLIGKKVNAPDVNGFLSALEPHGIYLFRVNFKSFSDDYAAIVNFGTGKERRAWITGVEAMFLRNLPSLRFIRVTERYR